MMVWNYWPFSNSTKNSSSLSCLLVEYFFCIFAICISAQIQPPHLLNFNSIPASSSVSQNFYKAAVVEYVADEDTSSLTPGEILLKNTNNYEKIILDAAREETDIIVFPEYGLTTLRFSYREKDEEMTVRDQIKPFLQYIPEVGDNPCDGYINDLLNTTRSEVIGRISCASRHGKIYTLINLGEISPCTMNTSKCPPSGAFHYNTAVTFDRDGTIVAKYRKINLFAEPQFDVPETREMSTFSTDFNVEFGVFICFDLLFAFPAKHLVAKGIKHFLFPTAWIDELPFLTAIQAQMFWSSSSEATILAAGYHQPEYGKLGSGIFSPSGAALNYTFNPDSGTQVIYAIVPILPLKLVEPPHLRTESSSKLILKSDKKKVESLNANHFYYRENLNNYTAKLIPLINDGEDNTVSVCDGDFCCEINYSLASSPPNSAPGVVSTSKDCSQKDELNLNSTSMNYKLVVFNQTRKFTSPSVIKTMHLQICAVVRCLNDSLQSCAEDSRGSQHDVLPGFRHLNLKADQFTLFDDAGSSQPTFTTLDTEFNLISVELFNLTYSNDKRSLILSTDKISNFFIQTVALFNRVY